MKYVAKIDKWCDRAWIKFGTCITLVMSLVIALNWNNWSTELKVIAGIAALIPMHVIEEWVFPGGFHYQYNLVMYKSDRPDRYPMCRVSDMITNLEATFGYIILTIISLAIGHVPTGVILGSIGFSLLEVFLHTYFGVSMYSRFKAKGKTTIYGPGSLTAYFGFGFFGILLFQTLAARTITAHDWLIAILLLAWIGVFCILIPENLIKNKDTKYYFKTNGYFDRFLG